MTTARRDGLYFLLLGGLLFLLVGVPMWRVSSRSIEDFKALYYASRCYLDHGDPYNESEMLHIYSADEVVSSAAMQQQLKTIAVYPYLPTTLLLIAPFAMLPWGYASFLWMLITAGGILLAAYLMWSVGADSAPVLSGCLVGFLLANCSIVLATGNAAGIVVSLCTIAVWCFLKNRFVRTGIVCLAISLVIKPHDAGLVWLYFLLAGRECRRRALQTFAVACALGLAAIALISQVSPSWIHELHSNLVQLSATGGINDLGPAGVRANSLDMKIGLQTVISVFRDDPHFYNGVALLVCGLFLLVWSIKTLRSQFSPTGAWFALAAVTPLTMLVTYHRSYDAKLLVLTIPACAMLWARGGRMGWAAMLLNASGFVLTGEFPMQLIDNLDKRLRFSGAGLSGQLVTVVSARPITLIVLVMAIFYLWVYLRVHTEELSGRVNDGFAHS